jgi:uncharacterized membrane protein
MNNRFALITSGIILMVFFLAGLLDIMYEWKILENLVSQLILLGAFISFVGYLLKVNLDKHKKNLP